MQRSREGDRRRRRRRFQAGRVGVHGGLDVVPPPPRARTNSSRKAHLDLAHATKLIACAEVDENRRVLYVLGLSSGGFSPGELYGLRFRDLRLDAPIPFLRITSALREKGTVKDESGRKKVRAAEGRPKTGYRERTNPVHSLAVRVLSRWHAEGWKAHVGRAPVRTSSSRTRTEILVARATRKCSAGTLRRPGARPRTSAAT